MDEISQIVQIWSDAPSSINGRNQGEISTVNGRWRVGPIVNCLISTNTAQVWELLGDIHSCMMGTDIYLFIYLL